MSTIIKFENKVVGHVSDDTFFTSRDENTLFKKFNSINISEKALNHAKAEGATKVSIKLNKSDKEETFEKSIVEIEQECDKYSQHYEDTDDYDKQYVLKLDWLRRPKEKRQKSLDAFELISKREVI